jgi:phosphatidylglycerophosphate synthase
MTEKKRESDRQAAYVFFVARPVSFYIAYVFLNLGISANQVTVIAVIVGLLGCILLASGLYWWAIIGGVLVNLWLVLDCVDGEIARYKAHFGQISPIGAYIDSLNADIMYGALFISIGIGVYNSVIHKGVAGVLPPISYAILGALGSLGILLYRIAGGKLSSAIREKTGPQDADSGATGFAHLIRMNLFNQAGFIHPLALVLAIFNRLDMFTIFYGITLPIMYLLSVAKYIGQLNQQGANK